MKISIARDICIGCGLCEGICPKVYKMDDENIAIVIVDTVPEDTKDDAIEALESCPVSAIKEQ